VTPILRLKQLITGHAPPAAEPDYRCLSCGERFDNQPQICPSCGGYDIQRSDWIDGAADPPRRHS